MDIDAPGCYYGSVLSPLVGGAVIRRIHISGYKSLVDCEVRLQPLSVILGPNAAGKSNFLDALQLLSRLAQSRTLKDAFEPPYRGTPIESFTFEKGGIAASLKKESLTFSIEVDVQLSQAAVDATENQIREMRTGKDGREADGGGNGYVRERSLRYRIGLEILPRSGILRVSDEYLAALTTRGEVRASRRPFFDKVGNKIHLRMEGQAHPTAYEVGLDRTILSEPVYPPHYPHLVAMRNELSRWHCFYFEPRERMRARNPVKEVRHIGLMGEDLAAFLNTLKALDPAQFNAVQRALRLLIPSITGIDVQPNTLGEVELQLQEAGVSVPARLVSEGTLRILGLLALSGVKEPPALIAFEEPENGIHPRRIELVAEHLRTRALSGKTQLVVTTHSPILPDLLPNESLFVCRRADGKTEILPFETWGPLGRQKAIQSGLGDEPATPVSTRILRGDFDA